MKIYTKTGDGGQTGFIGGRVSKAAQMIEVVGELDELNASLGVLVSSLKEPKYKGLDEAVLAVQREIFSLGMLIASPMMEELEATKQSLALDEATGNLESQIDNWDSKLDPLQNFILPGGDLAAAHAHLSRTICRRAERGIVKLATAEMLDPSPAAQRPEVLHSVQKYTNRLSDWLFTLASYINKTTKTKEEIWAATKQIPLKI